MTQMEILRRRGKLRWKRSFKLRFTLALLFLLAIILGAYALFLFRLRPMVMELAMKNVNVLYTKIVNDAVTQTLREGNIDYSDMIYFEKDYEGKITALCTNTALLNSLSNQITSSILERVENIDYIVVKLPLGTVSGPSILSGLGPTIKLRVVVGDGMHASFDTGFTEAGINQTLHRIVYSGDITCSLLFPGITFPCDTPFQVVAAETVIVGDVPQSYTFFSGVDDVTDAMDYYYNYQ